jgi:hypothetical protein
MISSIKKGKTEEEQKILDEEFAASHNLRNSIKEVLERKVESVRKEMVKKVNYDNPSWAYTQADYNGHIRALGELINLLD